MENHNVNQIVELIQYCIESESNPDIINYEKDDTFNEFVCNLLTLGDDECTNLVDAVNAQLPLEQQNWFLDELEVAAETFFFKTRSDKEYVGVLFAIPLVFVKSDDGDIPDKLTDAQRWSLENLLKVSGVLHEKTKFCRIASGIHHPYALSGLAPSSVWKMTRSLCLQAAEFEDRVEIPDNILDIGPFDSETEMTHHPRLMVGIAIVPSEYVDDIFVEDSIEDINEFSSEIARIFNFGENAQLSAISSPLGYYFDVERLSSSYRDARFKGLLDTILSNRQENEQLTVEIQPVEEYNYRINIFSSFEHTLIATGIWETFHNEYAEESLHTLLDNLSSYEGGRAFLVESDTATAVNNNLLTLQ